jgi:hypothetical protein
VAWGEGYAALSTNIKDKDIVVKYIINQQEHHKKMTFKRRICGIYQRYGKRI